MQLLHFIVSTVAKFIVLLKPANIDSTFWKQGIGWGSRWSSSVGGWAELELWSILEEKAFSEIWVFYFLCLIESLQNLIHNVL